MTQCPACAKELVEKSINSITVEVCDGGCGGVWFDWSEILKLDSLLNSGLHYPGTCRDENLIADLSRRYNCPRCKNMVMTRSFSRILSDLLLDECSSCGGLWLNGDEVEELPYLLDGYDWPESYADPRQQHLAHALQFLCPEPLTSSK